MTDFPKPARRSRRKQTHPSVAKHAPRAVTSDANLIDTELLARRLVLAGLASPQILKSRSLEATPNSELGAS